MSTAIKSPGQIRKVVPIPRQVPRQELPSNLTELQRALYYAAAPILHEPDVKAYQEVARKSLARVFWWREFGFCIVIFLGLATFFGFAGWQVSGESLWNVAGAVFFLVAAIGALLIACAVIGTSLTTPLAQWRSCSWSDYRGGREGIPTVVRKRAKTIARHCQGAVLTVEYLAEDPFLRVHHKGESYYVAVWDETGFVG